MSGFIVTIDADQFKEVEKHLGVYKSKASIVVSRALNRAMSNVKSNSSKRVRKDYYIKAKEVREITKTDKAHRNKLSAAVTLSGKKIPLNRFRVSPKEPRPNRPPKFLKVAVKKRGGLKPLKGAFVADIQGNKVWRRVGKNRLPIKRLLGPSIPEMVGNEEVRADIEREGALTYQRRLDHEIKRVLERGR